MRILVTGSTGQLGKALQELAPEARFLSRSDLDLADTAAIDDLDLAGVDIVVNAAAYTKVDDAETPEGRRAAWQANANGVAALALAADRAGAVLVTVSTDYVFAGDGDRPYREDDPIRPAGVYGVTKAAGELGAMLHPRHYVVRTSWVYGDGHNFVATMLRLGAARDELTVVGDQIGRPTRAVDLGRALLALAGSGAPFGVYHCTGSGEPVSWAGFAAEIMRLAGLACTVRPITTAEYAANAARPVAPRPHWSVLALDRLAELGITTPPWQDALAAHLVERVAGGIEDLLELARRADSIGVSQPSPPRSRLRA